MDIKSEFSARLRATLTGVAFAAYAATPAIAEDIEIYTTANLGATAIQPNVVFVVDSSGSMGGKLDVPNNYDYTQTYVGCYDAAMLYYTSGGSTPACNSKDKFLKTSGKCDAWVNLYDKGVIIDPVGPLEKYGFYADQIAQFHGSKNIWQGPTTNNTAQQAYLVECYTDSGVHGDAGPANPYIKDGGPWTSTVPANPSVPHPVWAGGDNSLQIYDGNYLNYTVDPVAIGTTSEKTRMEVAKRAVEAIVTANNNINIGLMRFDGSSSQGGYEGGAVMYPALDVKASRNDFKSRLNTINEGGYTPLAETYYEALLYFGGKQDVYGDLATPSNQTGTKENGNPNYYQTPITAECQKNYIVYLTDGAPTRDYLDATKRAALPGFTVGSCNTDPDPGVTSDFIQYNLDADTSGSSSRDHCLDELAGWARHNDVAERSYAAHDGTQLITTYTVGFDFSASPNAVDLAALKLLQDTAAAGGGSFHEAKSEAQLLGVFNQILAEILAVNSTFSSPAVSVNAYNRATNLDDLYFSLFKPANGEHWDGNLKKYKLATVTDVNGDLVPEVQDSTGSPAVDPNTGFFTDAAISFWTPPADAPDGAETAVGGAASMLATSRAVYTYTGAYSTSISGVSVPTSSTGLIKTTTNELNKGNTAITDAMLGGVASNPDIISYPGGVSTTIPYKDALLEWAKGDDILDEDGDQQSDEARRIIGDPLHAEPALVQYGEVSGDPDLVAYMATNDGYLHAIDSLDGTEYWAFVPQEMLSNLSNIFDNTGVTGKSYGLDGNVVPWVNDGNKDGDLNDTGDHVYLYFGQRRGGSDIFSMDVSDRNVPQLRWIIKGGAGDYAEMGQTWSTPNVERLKLNGATKTVLIFGGGYDTGQDTVTERTPDAVGRSVYIVDAEDGSLLWRAGPDGAADLQLTDMQYSIPGRIKPVDVDSNGYVDQLYFGDMGGQLWRIDIEESDTSSNLSTLITGGRIADFALDNSDINTRRFYYPPDVALIIESGQPPYLSIVAASGYRSHPLNQVIRDRMYMMRMDDIYDPPAAYTTLTEADLFNTTDNLIGEGTTTEKAAAVTSLTTSDGWYISFNELDGSYIGEKALAEPLIIGGVGLVTTYVPEDLDPNAASCVPKAGTGIIYYVNVTDGTPTFNISGTVDKTREDRKEYLKRGGIPPSPSVIITEGGTPTLCIGTECGSANMSLDLQKMYWYEVEQ